MFDILIQSKPVWADIIRGGLDHSTFNITFCDQGFARRDLEDFDAVCPLDLIGWRDLMRATDQRPLANALVPAPQTVMQVEDKAALFGFLAQQGFQDLIPPMGEAMRFPAVVKPARGVWGRGAHIVTSAQDLQRVLAQTDPGAHVVQSLIPGAIEYGTHLLCQDGKVLFDLTFENLMAKPNLIRGQDHWPLQRRQVATPHLDRFAQIVAALNFTGPCNFDYKIREGRPQIFEINPRCGGSLMYGFNAYLARYVAAVQRPLAA